MQGQANRLIWHLYHEFKLDQKPKGSKQTLRDSLLQVYKTTKKKPAALDTPQAPPELMYLLALHNEVFDGEELDYQKLYYWDQVSKRRLESWEMEIILQINRVYWRTKAEESK